MEATPDRHLVSDLVSHFDLASSAATTGARCAREEVRTSPLKRPNTVSWWKICSVWMQEWIAQISMAMKDATISLVSLLDVNMFPVL